MNKNKKFKATEITHMSMRSLIGACPAVFKTNRDSFVIVGNILDKEVYEEVGFKIGKGETAIEVQKDLITKLFD